MIKIDETAVLMTGSQIDILNNLFGYFMAMESNEELKAMHIFVVTNMLAFKFENPDCNFNTEEDQEKLMKFVRQKLEELGDSMLDEKPEANGNESNTVSDTSHMA